MSSEDDEHNYQSESYVEFNNSNMIEDERFSSGSEEI